MGEVLKTKLVEVVPVDPAAVYPVMLLNAVIDALEAFVPPFATGNTPVTPVVKGSPVQLVRAPDEGVPSTGVIKVGDVNVPVETVGFVSVGVVIVGDVLNTRFVLVVPVAPVAV